MCNVWYCIKCGHQTGECCCQSDASGCSGADARQTDKRNGLCNSPDCQKLGKCNAFDAEVECPVFSPSSAVSDRSGDGLLELIELERWLTTRIDKRNSQAGTKRYSVRVECVCYGQVRKQVRLRIEKLQRSRK